MHAGCPHYPAFLEGVRRELDREQERRARWLAMAEAARLVCDACASIAFPCYPEFRELRDGPPGSGNLVHIARPKGREDHPIVSGCKASSVWHAIAFERGFGGGAGARAMEGL